MATGNPTTEQLAGGSWSRLNTHALDVLLAAAFTIGAALVLCSRGSGHAAGYTATDSLDWILVLATSVPLALLRLWPIAVLAVVALAHALQPVLGFEPVDVGTYCVLVALFGASTLSGYGLRALAGAIAIAGLVIAYFAQAVRPSLGDLVTLWVSFSAVWVLGSAFGLYRTNAHVADQRARVITAEREAHAQAAVSDERARLARELHDAVGHTLNVVVIQAAGARRVCDTKPALAKQALAAIEHAGRQALMDMERMLGIMRERDHTGERFDAQPGLRRVQALAAQVTEAGLPVELTIDGTPMELAHSVDLSAYRIVQEALTNSLKHAGPARAHVVVHYGQTDLELEITDNGRGGRPGQGTSSGGRGLLGMRERVALFGGELRVGPRPEGGYRVWARLPAEKEEA